MSDERGVPGPFPWRPVTRLLASGFVVAGALYVAGLAAGQWLLGGNDDAMRRRIVAEVQASFASLTGDLERAAQAFTAPGPVRAALNEDVPATRALFDRLAQAAGPGSEVSLSVYAASGQPLAWAGRPSELPPDRAQDGESWFIIEGALGLRLVYVVAVLEGTTRIGLVSAERELDVSGRGRAAATLQGAPEGYQLETSLAPASLALPFEQTGAADPESFEIVAPSGQRLLSARVSPADLAATRTRWRDALQTITLAALAVWILLLAGPILDWRQAAPNWRERAAATGIIAGLLIGARLVLEIAPASRWSAWLLVTGEAYDSTLAGPFLSSPLDFLLSTFLLGSLVAVLFVAVHGGRARLRRRRTVDHAGALVRYAACAGAGWRRRSRRPARPHGAAPQHRGAIHGGSPALLTAAVEQRHAGAPGRPGRGARSGPGRHRPAHARRPPAMAAAAAVVRPRASRSAAGCCRSSRGTESRASTPERRCRSWRRSRRRPPSCSSRARSAPGTATARRHSG